MAVHSSSSPACRSLLALQCLGRLDNNHFPSTFNTLHVQSPPWMNPQFTIINSSASPSPPTLEENPSTSALSILELSFEASDPWQSTSQTQIVDQQDYILELLKTPSAEELAMEMYEKAKKDAGFRPQKATFEALLKYLVRSKRWESIYSILDDLRSYQVFPDSATCAEMIGACVGARKFRVVDLFLKAFNGDREVASTALETAMKGYNKLHMYSSSVAAYKRMRSSGVVLDPGGYCLIMEAYMKVGKSGKVLELFYELQSKVKLESTLNPTRVYEILIEASGRSGEAFKALGYFRDMRTKSIPANASIYSSLIGSFASAGEVKIAEQLVEEGRRNLMLKDPALFLKLVLMYVKEGSIEKTLDVVETMRGANMKVSDCIFCAITNGYAKQQGLRSAVGVYENLISQGIKPGQVTLASILNVYSRLGMYPEAEAAFGEMEKRGFDKCVVAYSSMIVMYGRTGKLREAMKLVAKMKSKGCEPNVWIYNSLIDLHGRAKNVKQVEKIWKEMKRRKVVPDIVSYTSLINTYSRAREYDKCLQIYQEFRLNGGVVDQAMAGIMVGVLSKVGRVDELVRLLQDMKAEGTKMDERLYRSALNALRDAGLQVQMSWLDESLDRNLGSPLSGKQNRGVGKRKITRG